jgi:ABC-2 type transport system permease protein
MSGLLQETGQRIRGTWAVVVRDLTSLFATPLAWVVGTLFLFQQGWNFSLLLRFLNDPLAAPGPVMQFYFGGSFFIFWLPVIFTCAVLSMRTIAEERRAGTLEALLTSPLHPAEVVLGKYFASLAFYVLLWVPTGVFYVLLRGATTAGSAAPPDIGPMLSGYLGTFLCGAAFLAIGVLSSALARSQLGAALGAFVASSVLVLAGLLVEHVSSPGFAAGLEWTSLLAMMQEMAAGIVDGHWLVLHAALITVALFGAIVAIDPRRDFQSWLQLLLVTGFAVQSAVTLGRVAPRADWTAGRVYELSDRAAEVLREMPGPIDVVVLVPTTLGAGRPNPVRGELKEVLTRMAAHTDALRIRLLDPDRERQEAEQLVVDFGLAGRELADGVVLVRAGQGRTLRRAHLLPRDLVTFATGPDVQVNGPRVESFVGEEKLLATFLRVTDEARPRVCYTQGHGEPRFDDLEPYAGYAHLRDLLREANLDTEVADLDVAGGIAACDLVLVAGPQGLLPPAHVDALRRHLQGGGRLLVLAGAVILRGEPTLVANGLEPLLAEYGIRYGERVVLDPHPMAGGSPLLAFTLVEGWADHPAVRSLVMRTISFVQVRELQLDDDVATLFQVGEDAWAESDLSAFQQGLVPRFDEGEDRPGPIPVVAASERHGARIVVIASDQFALNALLREDIAYDHGRDLVLNAVGWLVRRESMLGIRPRAREHVKLVLAPEQLERMTLLCLIGLPAFAALLGLWVTWRRR